MDATKIHLPFYVIHPPVMYVHFTYRLFVRILRECVQSLPLFVHVPAVSLEDTISSTPTRLRFSVCMRVFIYVCVRMCIVEHNRGEPKISR